MPAVAGRITRRYYKIRGEVDAERFDILFVEEPLTIPLSRHIQSNGRLDLVTQDRERGIVLIWEHKSTQNVPSTAYRLRDLQTALYARKLEEMGLCPPIDCVMWNYILTKEPTEPERLKSGELTQRANLDSDWETYSEAIKHYRLDPSDYEIVRMRLRGRELSHYFPRFEQPIVSETDVLFRDYYRTARDIRRSRKAWEEGTREPVRNLSLRCDWCEMAPLCNAALLAGDDQDIRELRYTVLEAR